MPQPARAGHLLSLPTLHCSFGSWAPAQVTDARPSGSLRWPASLARAAPVPTEERPAAPDPEESALRFRRTPPRYACRRPGPLVLQARSAPARPADKPRRRLEGPGPKRGWGARKNRDRAGAEDDRGHPAAQVPWSGRTPGRSPCPRGGVHAQRADGRPPATREEADEHPPSSRGARPWRPRNERSSSRPLGASAASIRRCVR